MEKILFTPKEAAGKINVATGTLYNWKAKGLIGYKKIGRSLRFSIEDLNAFIAKNSYKQKDN
jgi:excisionase family DNA binding protein